MEHKIQRDKVIHQFLVTRVYYFKFLILILAEHKSTVTGEHRLASSSNYQTIY